MRASDEAPIFISFLFGFLLLAIKLYAYLRTSSLVVFADLLESVVHLLVVGFSGFSVILAKKPADLEHHYGHDRVAFFSAGFEGAMILGASLSIFFSLIGKNSYPSHLTEGAFLFFLSFLLNGALGFYLLKRGRALKSLILESNGKHLYADCVSSGGIVLALIAVRLTGLTFLDPLFALLVAAHILWTGVRLVRKAVHGLMDRADPQIHEVVTKLLNRESENFGIEYHRLRHRQTGNRVQVDVHLLFPKKASLASAHEIATKIERKLATTLSQPVDLVSHLEPLEGHDAIHEQLLGRKEDF